MIALYTLSQLRVESMYSWPPQLYVPSIEYAWVALSLGSWESLEHAKEKTVRCLEGQDYET